MTKPKQKESMMSKKQAIMYAHLDRPDSKWVRIGMMDIPSAKGQVTRCINRGGAGMFPRVGYRKKDCEGVTSLAFKSGSKWIQGANARDFEAGH